MQASGLGLIARVKRYEMAPPQGPAISPNALPPMNTCDIMLTQQDIVSTSDFICAEAHENMV